MPMLCECRSFVFHYCSVLAYVFLFFISLGDIPLFHGVTTKHNGWRVMGSNNLAIQKTLKN